MTEELPGSPLDGEEPEGLLKTGGASWGDHPLDEMLIRDESRTIHDVIRRINQSSYVMDPDFQRDFIWSEKQQSKLIESIIMRVPLPVFYMAEDPDGRVVVVDGLQRLSTIKRFVGGELALRLPDRSELDGKRFVDLSPKFQNRIEDFNLTFYTIDSKTPERARLDIFERVNSGQPLTRQQMRNSLYMGKATRFLKDEAGTEVFRKATGGSLNAKTMRDREFVNRFCAFETLGVGEYRRNDMDDFLARSLVKMNRMSDAQLSALSGKFRRGLRNNLLLSGQHAFRRREPGQEKRGVLNASLWDVMSTGLSRYRPESLVDYYAPLRKAVRQLLQDESFKTAITCGPNDPRRVKERFTMSRQVFREILGDCPASRNPGQDNAPSADPIVEIASGI